MVGMTFVGAATAFTRGNHLAITALAAWRAARFFDYMGLHATRRQLSRIGLFDEHGEDVDDPAPTPTPVATPAGGESRQ